MIIVVFGIVGLALIIGGYTVFDKCYGWKESIGGCSLGIGICVSFVFVIMLIISILATCNPEAAKVRLEQRYESITYQLENDLYDNDNDLGKKELYDQVQEWNEDLATHKVNERNFWIGCFHPNIYDDFEFIEYE